MLSNVPGSVSEMRVRRRGSWFGDDRPGAGDQARAAVHPQSRRRRLVRSRIDPMEGSVISRGAVALPAVVALALVSLAPIAVADGVTTLNGSAPPGVPAVLENMTTMFDRIDADGNRQIVVQGVRRAGTRTPIHIHESGGLTCVLSGTITDFVEGMEPMVFPAGTCYSMPPNVPMAAANLGVQDVTLIDNFTGPANSPVMTVLEPGWQDYLTPMP